MDPVKPLRETVEEIRAVSRRLMDPEFALRTFEFAWDARIVVSDQATIQFVNGQAEILFGYLREEMYDNHINMLVPEDVRDQHRSHLTEYFQHPRVRPMQGFRGRTRDGREFDASIYLVPIQWRQGLLIDATIRKK